MDIYPEYRGSIQYWSSYTKFAMAIKGMKFNKLTIDKWFSKLVDKDDYDKSDKMAILDHLYNYSRDVLSQNAPGDMFLGVKRL